MKSPNPATGGHRPPLQPSALFRAAASRASQAVSRMFSAKAANPIEDGQGWRATMESLMSAWFRGIAIVEVDWE